MRGKRIIMMAASMLAVVIGLVPESASAAGPGNHVMYVLGRSTVLSTCQYVWADTNAGQAGIQPDLDQLGIPRPSTLPPTCDATKPACDLRRNLGAHAGVPGAPPPCAGKLSATENQCQVADMPGSTCDLIAPTWFYGFCGQTYGGESNGSLKIADTPTWTMDDFGFPRGRGIWEFNGRLTKITGEKGYMRFYLAAAPDQPTEAAACDGVGKLTSIYFTGMIITSDTPLPRAFAPTPANPSGHWNYCDNSPAGAGLHYEC
jgi:hypothetical protein